MAFLIIFHNLAALLFDRANRLGAVKKSLRVLSSAILSRITKGGCCKGKVIPCVVRFATLLFDLVWVAW